MKDYLFCHIKKCGYKIGVDINANQMECVAMIDEYKKHLRSHSIDDIIDTLFSLLMFIRKEDEERK